MSGRLSSLLRAPPQAPPPSHAGASRRFAALHHRNFVLLWSASLFSNSGSWMQIVAQGWLVYNLTSSPFYLGLVGFAKAIPMLVLPPMGGVVADRVPRLKLLKITQAIQLILATILGLLVSTGWVQVWHIVLLSFLQGAVNAFDQPTYQALLPELVPREDLTGAIALNSSTWQGAALFGPSLAGLTATFLGVAAAFYANAASYLAVVVALLLMRGIAEYSPSAVRRGLFDDLWEGLRYVGATRLIFTLLLLALVNSVFGRPYQQLLPVFAHDLLHTGVSGFGLLTSAPGAGAIVGAVLVSAAGGVERKGRLLFMGMFLFSVSVVLLALSHSFILSLAILFLIGLTTILFSTMLSTILQLEAPGQMRGRVMSLVTVTMQGFGPLGALLIGGLATKIGTPQAVTAGALVVAAAALVASLRAPVLRRYAAATSAPSH